MPVHYDPWLVLTSILVAMLASYAALSLASRVSATRGRAASRLWLAGGAMSMGIGIWSMHFVGMLAASLPIPMAYNVGWTLLSLLIAMVISGFALFFVSTDTLGWNRLAVGGAIMGAGIASMHYIGMAAVEVSPSIAYSPGLFILSVVIAMVASCVALWLFFHLRSPRLRNPVWKRLASAMVMGFAIAGMHYTGMAAANFSPDSVCTVPADNFSNAWLAAAITGFTVMMLAITLVVALFDSHLADRAATHSIELLEMNERLREESAELARANEQLREEIRQRVLAEKTLVSADSANRAKSEFLATMSHEIRTPLNGVLGLVELMSLSPLAPQQRSTLEAVHDAGKSLLHIIDDILDFSKIEAGKLDVRPEAASIRSVVASLHNIYSGSASSKGLVFKHSVDPRISPALLVDPFRLRQILNNFLNNAIKFTPKGSIELRAEWTGRSGRMEHIRISVQDTGIGISQEHQQQLFQPFAQGDANTARQFGGTGLGLAICQRLARMMGGSIDMVSEPGMGTTMALALQLPIADPAELPAPDANLPRGSAASGSGLRRPAPSVQEAELEGTLVLLVDDHPTNRQLLMRQVHALGYAAESAADGAEALALWETGRFGLVVTDCNMPEMDGYELARRIRAAEEAAGEGKHTPIIACTANAMAGESARCIAAGMDDFLVKPVSLARLMKKLDDWLPISRADEAGAGWDRAGEVGGMGTGAWQGDAGAAPADVPAASAEAWTVGAAWTDASAAAQEPPVDRSIIAEASGGDPLVERLVFTDFRRTNDEDVALVMRHLADGDLAQARKAIHRIKGASRGIGANDLAQACERLEKVALAHDIQTVEDSMDELHTAHARLNRYIESLRPELPPLV